MNKQGSKPIGNVVSRRCLISAVLPALLLSGCKNNGMQIRGGGFRNLTDNPIRDVELLVPETGKIVSCSYIPTGGFFSLMIPVQPYENNEIVVSWTVKGDRMKAGPLKIDAPDPLPSEPVVVVVRFYPTGKARALFVPQSKVPKRFLR